MDSIAYLFLIGSLCSPLGVLFSKSLRFGIFSAVIWAITWGFLAWAAVGLGSWGSASSEDLTIAAVVVGGLCTCLATAILSFRFTRKSNKAENSAR